MDIEGVNLDGVDRIFFDISMELFNEFNETLCNINAHLGDIYSYKDLEDVEKAQSEKEIKLLRQAVEIQQLKIDKQEKIINAMAKDIINQNIDEDICRQYKMNDDCYADICDDNTACIECIKQYYEKKVSEEIEPNRKNV